MSEGSLRATTSRTHSRVRAAKGTRNQDRIPGCTCPSRKDWRGSTGMPPNWDSTSNCPRQSRNIVGPGSSTGWWSTPMRSVDPTTSRRSCAATGIPPSHVSSTPPRLPRQGPRSTQPAGDSAVPPGARDRPLGVQRLYQLVVSGARARLGTIRAIMGRERLQHVLRPRQQVHLAGEPFPY